MPSKIADDEKLIDIFLDFIARNTTVRSRHIAKILECNSLRSRNCDPSHSTIMKVMNMLRKLRDAGLLRVVSEKRDREGRTETVKYQVSEELRQLVLADRDRARRLIKRVLGFA